MADYDFEQFKQDFVGGVASAADAVATAARDTGSSVGRYKDFLDIGVEVAKLGNTTHGGNISVSDGTNIWITRTAARLSRITPSDIVQCAWEASEKDVNASMELVVHREIYHALARKVAREAVAAGTSSASASDTFGTKAIIHAHCLYANLQSFFADKIEPVDSEGKLLLGEVSVLACEQTVASAEVGLKLAELAEGGTRIAVVRGHGPFVIGESLENALQLLSALEYSAHLLSLLSAQKVDSCRSPFV
jgi:L-fuculose-phosphate aldolase